VLGEDEKVRLSSGLANEAISLFPEACLGSMEEAILDWYYDVDDNVITVQQNHKSDGKIFTRKDGVERVSEKR